MSLEIISSNKFVGFPDGNILSWCPKMDLLAVSMNKTSIWVFRLNGDRVYSINNRAAILDLRWNHSGKFFVVSGTDSMIKVYDANNGRMVNQLPTSDKLPITLTSWSLVDVERSIGDDEKGNAIFNDLFKCDILKSLPKLSNELAPSVADNGTTANHSAVLQTMSDSVTNTNENENLLDCLLVVNANALLSMTFNNLFTVSDIELPPGRQYLKHATPESLFSQYFLVEESSGQLQLCELKLQLGDFLKRKHLLETIEWCSQIVSIINHIHEQVSLVVAEAETFLKVLDRQLGNFKDVLYEEADLTKEFPLPSEVEDRIVEALMDMLVTGLIPEKLKSYWVDQFGERGLMRVSALGNSAYDNARKILFSQVILALEKLIILLTNLEGVAEAEINFRLEALGMSVDSIKSAISQSQDMIKQIYAFIWKVNDEQEAMNKFLNWCKVEVIEKLAKEGSDPEAFFAAHPTIEFKASPIMEYFETNLLHPVFFQSLDMKDDDYETVKKVDVSMPNLHTSIAKLHQELNQNLLEGVQLYISKTVKFEEPLTLDLDPNQTKCDINLDQSNIYVSGRKDQKLTIVKVSGLAQVKKELTFPGKIVSHRLIGSLLVLVLFEELPTNFKLSLVSIDQSGEVPHIISSLSFNELSSAKYPELLAINGTDDPSHIIGCVLDRTMKENVVFKVNT